MERTDYHTKTIQWPFIQLKFTSWANLILKILLSECTGSFWSIRPAQPAQPGDILTWPILTDWQFLGPTPVDRLPDSHVCYTIHNHVSLHHTAPTEDFLVRGLAVRQSEECHINDDSTSPAGSQTSTKIKVLHRYIILPPAKQTQLNTSVPNALNQAIQRLLYCLAKTHPQCNQM